jgi:hypothetical protein
MRQCWRNKVRVQSINEGFSWCSHRNGDGQHLWLFMTWGLTSTICLALLKSMKTQGTGVWTHTQTDTKLGDSPTWGVQESRSPGATTSRGTSQSHCPCRNIASIGQWHATIAYLTALTPVTIASLLVQMDSSPRLQSFTHVVVHKHSTHTDTNDTSLDRWVGAYLYNYRCIYIYICTYVTYTIIIWFHIIIYIYIYPRCSMYSIFTYIWLIYGVNDKCW